MKKLALYAFFLITVIAICVSCSQNNVYRLIKVNSYEGTVTVQRNEKINAFQGLQLISKDRVEVESNSHLELLADSDKHIVAEENTAFTLKATGTEQSGNITVDLLYGKALFTIENKLNEGSSFEVNTPNAALSVRGTIFSVKYSAEERFTTIEVTDGTVYVVYVGGEITLQKGEAIAIKDKDGETVAEDVAATTPGGNKENPVLYSTLHFNVRSENPDIERFSVLTYKDLLNIELPEDPMNSPTISCNAKIDRDGDYNFETINGDIIKPFAEKLMDYYTAHKDELNKIMDEAIADYFNDPLFEADGDKVNADINLDPTSFDWVPNPLIFESEYGNSKLNTETITPKVTVYLTDNSVDGLYPIGYTDTKTGKIYYLTSSYIELRCYGMGERIN